MHRLPPRRSRVVSAVRNACANRAVAPDPIPRSVLSPDLHLSFAGFPDEGLDALARIRADPTTARLRAEKEVLDRAVHAPFRAYRDDLVVNWVIPNGLPFETERNVFSRLPKNDFGAGGAHHHLWLAFYRPPRTRLTDLQLSHTVSPDGFRFGLFLGERAHGLFEPARRRLVEHPGGALPVLNALLADGFTLAVGRGRTVETIAAALKEMPAALARADRFFVERRLSRDALQALGPGLVAHALYTLGALWPLYRWLDAAADDAAEAPRSA